jgi:hypothetical protein
MYHPFLLFESFNMLNLNCLVWNHYFRFSIFNQISLYVGWLQTWLHLPKVYCGCLVTCEWESFGSPVDWINEYNDITEYRWTVYYKRTLGAVRKKRLSARLDSAEARWFFNFIKSLDALTFISGTRWHHWRLRLHFLEYLWLLRFIWLLTLR